MKHLAASLLTLLSLLLLPTVAAARPAEASGSFVETSTQTDMREAGKVTIVSVDTSFTITGTFSGTCSGTETDIIHAGGSVNFHGRCSFTGSVAGRSGIAVISYAAAISGDRVHSFFAMSQGSDGLEGVHAWGSFTITGPAAGDYTGFYQLGKA